MKEDCSYSVICKISLSPQNGGSWLLHHCHGPVLWVESLHGTCLCFQNSGRNFIPATTKCGPLPERKDLISCVMGSTFSPFLVPSSSLFNFQELSNKLISITGFCFPGSLHRQHKSDLLLIKATSIRFAASASRMCRPMVKRFFQSWDLGKIWCAV